MGKGYIAPFCLDLGFKPYKEYWVDPNAKTNGNGSQANPFNSLQNARTAVRSDIPSMEGDIVINLKGGTYHFVDNQNYFYLGKEDGGANGHNVIWKNARGEEPVISGSRPVTGFTQGENGIWQASVSGIDNIYGLTVNGKAATLAKTEEPIHATKFYSGFAYSGYSGGIGFSKNDLPAISNPQDAFVHVASSWIDVMYTVDSVSTDGNNYKYVVDSDRLKNTTATGKIFGAKSTSVGTDDYFYIENAKELLDNPGEFYYDKSAKVLYYMPRIGENMATASVNAATSDHLINIFGEKDNHVKNITISGIKFENATYADAYTRGFTTVQATTANVDVDKLIQGSIWIDYADNIEISDCEFTGIAKPAISFVEGVLDSRIVRNKFTNIGSSAVTIGTNVHDSLEGNEERCERNTIADNIIENSGLLFRGSPAITCYYVADTNIDHNKIINSNYSGISLGWGWANHPSLTFCANNRVSNNYIENINLVASDGGAVYTLGNLPNNVVEGNYYVQTKMPEQTVSTIGLYADEGTQNVTMRNNVIDMATIKDYDGELFAISAWTDSIKNVVATNNYATFTAIRNEGTNCTINTPTAYTRGTEPSAVQDIISASAFGLE